MKKMLFLALFLLAFSGRLFKLGPNIEFVTGVMILASYYLGQRYAVALVLLVMALTDLIIGNTNIFLFTWSGFLIPAILLRSDLIRKWGFKRSDLFGVFKLTGFGFGSNVFFFLWTNFGVWALDSWGMYEKNLPGLIRCYINGLPFLKNQILSSLIIIPVGFLAIKIAVKYSEEKNRALVTSY